MIVLINVTISNGFDDSTRNVLLSCSSTDVDTLNNLGEFADMFVDLCEWSYEKITSIDKIKPINISSNKQYYDIVENAIYVD